jgi:Family of unknown function (DUF6445)
MNAWLDEAGCFFNPKPRVSVVPLPAGNKCIVIDDALANPQGLVNWAAAQSFVAPPYPYPGLVHDLNGDVVTRLGDFFAEHARSLLGARRTQDISARLSLITTPPASLMPIQWLCHRDRFEKEQPALLFAAGVLYLFHDPGLGGTSFYLPRQSAAQTDQLVADSQNMTAVEFGARYGLQAGYMADSNPYFERVVQVPAAWNRAIFYDGGLFHSADVGDPAPMSADPLRGRLTFNSFLTCRKAAV